LSELLDRDAELLGLHHVLLGLQLRGKNLLLSLKDFYLLLKGVLFHCH
jgi:hypothetical protein